MARGEHTGFVLVCPACMSALGVSMGVRSLPVCPCVREAATQWERKMRERQRIGEGRVSLVKKVSVFICGRSDRSDNRCNVK